MTKKLSMIVPVYDGKCHFSQVQLATVREFLFQFPDGRAVQVTWEKPKSVRSLKANAYYWGVVLTTISRETGNTTEDLHLAFRDMLLPRRFIKIGNREVEARKTTTELSTREFAEYVERVCAEAASMGIAIPTAE